MMLAAVHFHLFPVVLPAAQKVWLCNEPLLVKLLTYLHNCSIIY